MSWPTSLTFLERRTHILRALEERNLLAAFRWSEDVTGVLLGASGFAEISSRRAEVHLVGSAEDLEKGRVALEIILSETEPEWVSVDSVLAQVLLPVDLPYLDARRRLASTGAQGMADTQSTDVAILLDGQAGDPPVRFQVEYGVISDEEAPDRVARRVGRMSGPRSMPPLPGNFFEQNGYPICSLFFDWLWVPGTHHEGEAVLDEIWILRDELANLSQRLAGSVQAATGLDTMQETSQEADA